MNKIFKRLLSVVLALVMVVTLVPLSSVETVKAAEGTKTIYLDTTQYKVNGSNGWAEAYIHLYNNTGDVYDNKMTAISPGLYSYEVDTSKYTSVVFKPNSDNWSGKTADLTIPSDSKNMYYCTTFDSQTKGTWRTYSGNSGESDSSTFYVRADLIDYYNNDRVGKGDSLENRYNNQGNWTGPSNNNAPYSKLNNWISSLPGYADVPIDTNGDGTRTIYWDNTGRVGKVYIHYWGGGYENTSREMEYEGGVIYKVDIPAEATNCLFTVDENFNEKLTGDLALTRFNLFTYQTKAWSYYGESSQSAIPLYFGDLFHRVQLTGDPNGTVNEFYRGANVSFTGETGAVAQGIVGDHLVNGCLVTSYSDEVKVPFFEEGAYDDQNQYMKFYKNLQFPFTATTIGKVTKYSFNSKNQTVYYDYENQSIKSSDEEILDASDSHGRGYFPFNQNNPLDKSELNYGFGTKFTIPFTISPDGKDANKEDVTFNFTGDDDVWVFIDDALVLDMGGAHELASGNINFRTQTATVTTGTADATIDYNIYGGNSAFVSNDKKEVSFEDITVKMSNGETSTLADYMKKENTVHTLTMYYMERGMWNSNMSIDFSFVPLPSGMTLSKQVNTAKVNAGLKSAVEAADTFDFEIQTKDLKEPNSTFKLVENLGYTVTSRNKISFPEQSASNGVVEGLSSVFYAHNFIDTTTKGKIFYSGTGFEIKEMIPEESALKYESTEWKVYDGSNLSTPEEQGTDMTARFSMGNADSSQFDVYTKYVNFINTPQVGNVTFTKTWQTGAAEDGDTFEFTVLVDIDGDGSDYEYTPYALDYTYIGSDKAGETTGSDGKFSLQSGEKIQFNGIPVGAKVKVTETPEENAYWEAVNGEYEKEITVTEGENNSLEIQNTSKAVTLDKVIYVEAGREDGTNYTLKDSDDANITLTDISSSEGITIGQNSDGTVNFKSDNADKKYEVTYSGTKTDGTIVTGKITVFTYKATNKVYVFDFGLESDLTATNDNGDGLFQGGVFYNTEAQINDSTKTTAVLGGITDDGATPQTDVVADSADVAINQSGTSNGKVTFKPQAFMDQAENYKYTANITKQGSELDASNPETGTVVNGTIKVMPANTVYYEDNFNADKKSNDSAIKIIYTDGVETSQTAPTDKQSNDQSENYGHDDAYADDLEASGESFTTMTDGDGAYFTFKGTGFDIISRTNNETAGIIAYVYQGKKTEFNPDDFTVSAKNDPENPLLKTIMVDTYYSNGDLYQVPVISTKMETHGEYTVFIRALRTYSGQTTIYIDGIRIYNPLDNNTGDYIATEKNVTVSELRDLYVNDKIEIVTSDTDGYYIVDGETAVEQYLPDTPETGAYIGAETVGDVINNGPNNELYLSFDNGIAFKVNKWGAEDWTLQIGAKSVSADDEAVEGEEAQEADKSITVYVKPDDASIKTYAEVGKYTLNTSTDMYYDIKATDLTEAINKYNTQNSTNWSLNASYYDILILNTSDNWNNYDIISLTTLKHNGSYVGAPMARTTISGYSIQGRNVQQKAEEVILSAEFNAASVTRGKYAKMTVVTAGNVEDLKVVDPTGKEVSSFSNKTSETDENGNKVWNLTFKVIKQKGEAVYQISAVVDGKENGGSYPASIAIK